MIIRPVVAEARYRILDQLRAELAAAETDRDFCIRRIRQVAQNPNSKADAKKSAERDLAVARSKSMSARCVFAEEERSLWESVGVSFQKSA